MTHKIVLAFAAAALLVLFAPAAHAITADITVMVDENGNGSATIVIPNTPTTTLSLTGSLASDPGPGGLASALTYNLSTLGVSVTAGDVGMLEGPPGATIVLSDIVRFNAPSSLVFYSDATPPVDNIADTGFPTARYTNTFTTVEVGPEGNNGVLYTPTDGQPGFDLNGAVLHYDFVSDSAVPLPATLPLFATGIGALGLLGWRRKRKAQAVQSFRPNSLAIFAAIQRACPILDSL